MSKMNVIIDCDTGIDDAIALVFACGMREKINILAVTTVAGNVGIENTTKNTLNVLNLIGAGDIPVAKGAEKPLQRESLKASGVHGVTGLRGYEFNEDSTAAFVDIPAWDLMYEKINGCAEKTTLIAIGPVTNITLLLRKYPDIKQKIEKVVFMGTSYHDGNPTSVATFNVLVDPEAFRELLESGIDVYACPLETTRKAYINPLEIEKIGTFGNKASELVHKIMLSCGVHRISKNEKIAKTGEEEINEARIRKSAENQNLDLHDPATVALTIFPELFTINKYYCDVECKGEFTTGFTLIDKRDYHGKSVAERNLFWAETIDRESFINELYNAIKKCN